MASEHSSSTGGSGRRPAPARLRTRPHGADGPRGDTFSRGCSRRDAYLSRPRGQHLHRRLHRRTRWGAPSQLARKLGVELVDLTRNGNTTHGVLADLARAPSAADFVTLTAGGNDLL